MLSYKKKSIRSRKLIKIIIKKLTITWIINKTKINLAIKSKKTKIINKS